MTASLYFDDAMRIMRKLPKKQRDVLDQVMVNLDEGHPLQVLEALEKKGLIRRMSQQKDFLPGMPMEVVRWDMASVVVHAAWCQVCTEEHPEDALILAMTPPEETEPK